MSEYTPWANPDQAGADFDRWLAAHDAQVKAEAWGEAMATLLAAPVGPDTRHAARKVRDENPYWIAGGAA